MSCSRLETMVLTTLLLAATTCWAETQPFCMLQKVDVGQVSNATVITLEADGLIEMTTEGLETWTQDEQHNWYPQALERITFTLRNVRGGAAPMVQIARYPVSHIEFALPPGEQQNVGVRCTLVLYKGAIVTKFDGVDDNWDFGSWRPAGPRVMIYPSQKRDKILITVISDRPEEPEAKRPDEPRQEPRLEVSGDTKAVTLKAFKADMHQVIKMIGEQTGAPIWVDEPVSNLVTANFEKMPLQRLLTSLATAYGLCLSQMGQDYHLSQTRPDSATAYWVGETRMVQLHYVPVQQALLLLPDAVLPYVHRMEANNSLILSGPRQMLDRIASDLAVIDKPGYQCRLRAWVIGTQSTDQSLREVLGGFADGDTSVGFDSSGNLSVETGSAVAEKLLVRLQALQTKGRLRMQSLPSVWCKSGYSASLFMGQRIYYWRFASIWSEEQTLDAAQAGTELTFYPRTDGEWITAWVTVQSDVPGQASPTGPVLMRRSAKTTVRLRSGQMMLIGGLLQSDSLRHRAKPTMLPWPADALASGRLRIRQDGEVAVLVQMEAALMPPTESPDKLQQPALQTGQLVSPDFNEGS
ncbi:MAG: hypothetical protein ABFE08_15905 [Armatimonadia bacterium]